jgi:hypothetical protein
VSYHTNPLTLKWPVNRSPKHSKHANIINPPTAATTIACRLVKPNRSSTKHRFLKAPLDVLPRATAAASPPCPPVAADTIIDACRKSTSASTITFLTSNSLVSGLISIARETYPIVSSSVIAKLILQVAVRSVNHTWTGASFFLALITSNTFYFAFELRSPITTGSKYDWSS